MRWTDHEIAVALAWRDRAVRQPSSARDIARCLRVPSRRWLSSAAWQAAPVECRRLAGCLRRRCGISGRLPKSRNGRQGPSQTRMLSRVFNAAGSSLVAPGGTLYWKPESYTDQVETSLVGVTLYRCTDPPLCLYSVNAGRSSPRSRRAVRDPHPPRRRRVSADTWAVVDGRKSRARMSRRPTGARAMVRERVGRRGADRQAEPPR